MKHSLNYINSLPDFLTMQRSSFCWFITQGLTEELGMFSKITDFGQKVEHTVFGEEYRLIKPSNTLLIARKYEENYKAKLVIPLEVRSQIENIIYYYNQFPIVALPLMTTYATFIINGCERVIVSQIIRSPGLYFEKHKNRKVKQSFKRKFSANIEKLRSFLPSGDAFLSEFDLFMSMPTLDPKKHNPNRTVLNWEINCLYSYSIKSLQQTKEQPSSYFLQCFKFYQTVLRSLTLKTKSKLLYLFLKWLQTKDTSIFLLSAVDKLSDLLKYFNSIAKLLVKCKFADLYLKKKGSDDSNSSTCEKSSFAFDSIKYSPNNFELMIQMYDKVIFSSYLMANIQLNSRFISINKIPPNLVTELSTFPALTAEMGQSVLQKNTFVNMLKAESFRPVIYFSTSVKDQIKYSFKRRIEKEKDKPDKDPNAPWRHRYLKTNTKFLTYKQDHEIYTYYHKKYQNKDLYTAIVIPEYGSWIRLGFQKNTVINSYNYPLKNQEDEIILQLDKVTQKPVLQLLKELGLTDVEIRKNLQYSDFFYFERPLLVKSIYTRQPVSRFPVNLLQLENISEFSRIFDPYCYRLGKVGRLKLNKRLNIKTSEKIQALTFDDIFAIVDKLLELTTSNSIPDDIDHLKNRRVRSIGELLQNLFRIGFQRLVRQYRNKIARSESDYIISFSIINAVVSEFFGSSQLSQYLDQTNPLSSLTHKRRISGLGPGGLDRDRISFAIRDIHPSHYGRICPIETSEGKNVGLIASLTTCARVNKSGFLETPFWRVINGKVLKTGNPIYLTAELEDLYKIAPADLAIDANNYIIKNVTSVRYRQDFMTAYPSEIDFISISMVQIVSIGASLIPFFEHDDANRTLMGSNMQRQAVPLLFPQKPIVGTGLENQIATDSGLTLHTRTSGVVHAVTAKKIVIHSTEGKYLTYRVQKYLRSNQKTCINYRPSVWKGECLKSGQMIADGPAVTNGELALGQNTLVAYMPWQGYNFEDAILISERLIYDNIFTSIHIERYKIEVRRNTDTAEEITKLIPNLDLDETKHLNTDGIIRVGTFVQPNHILVGKIEANNASDLLPESKLLRAIFGSKSKAKGVKDSSYRMPERGYGRVIETITLNYKTKSTYRFDKIYIFVAQIRKIKVGDKIAGRHGNKGIISRILARQDMPFLPDGTPVDIILNPLGVPSRMNVGQLYECLLGLAGDKLDHRFKILPFDEMYGPQMSRILINKKLRQASIQKNEGWLFNPYAPGKMVLIDGRTGKEFENPITVGNAYMLKLIHLVDDKMHARATGPYSLITQQPLKGKAQHGGQRFGEMEVWALEGFGAAFTLKELLTIKSDDIRGRNETLTAIVKGTPLPKSGIPESFKVLVHELRSIGLDLTAYRVEGFNFNNKSTVKLNFMENSHFSTKTFSPTFDLNNISF